MKLAGKKKNYNHSLLLKVLFIYFLIFAVPIILLYASLYGTSKRLAQKEGASQLLSSLTSISNTMDEVFRSVNFVQSQLQGNTAFSNDCFRLTVDESAGVGYRNYRLRQELSMELTFAEAGAPSDTTTQQSSQQSTQQSQSQNESSTSPWSWMFQ